MKRKGSKRLYYKLLCIYTGIILAVVVILAAAFLSNSRNRVIESNQNYIRMLSENALEYIEKSENRVDYVMEDLYKSATELDDLLSYLTMDTEEYLEHTLDIYGSLNTMQYKGVDDFASGVFSMDSHITRIAFLSYSNLDITIHYPDKRVWHSRRYDQVLERLEAENLADPGEFSFAKEIRDPNTWETAGCMIITFSNDLLEAYYEYYSKADLLVFNQRGTIVYDSQEQYKSDGLLIWGEDKSDGLSIQGQDEEWAQQLKAYVSCGSIGNYKVLAYMPRRQAEKLPVKVWITILFFSVVAVTLGELLILYYLGRLEARLNSIVEGMEQVTMGNLAVSLKVNKKGDELDIISDHFNGMCRELDRYIQKSYLAEIEQKNAEMEALQSQINPHFLYNTLEAIRMKAICNGDREVGKMIYSMTVLFRSQVKESSVITMVQELHYCKKYLDLFQMRYQNQFTADVECPEELYQTPIIKFVLQPLLENYFIHGMRKENSDNYLKLTVKREQDEICIVLEDNGYGMEDDILKKKNYQLAKNEKDPNRSIGIANVNRRIRAVYGEPYGIMLEHTLPRGLRVILRYPLQEES